MRRAFITVIIIFFSFVFAFSQQIPDSLLGYNLDTIVSYNLDSTQIDTLIVCRKRVVHVIHDTVTIKVKPQKQNRCATVGFKSFFSNGFGYESNNYYLNGSKLHIEENETEAAFLPISHFSTMVESRLYVNKIFAGAGVGVVGAFEIFTKPVLDSITEINTSYINDTIGTMVIANEQDRITYLITRKKVQYDTIISYSSESAGVLNSYSCISLPVYIGCEINKKKITIEAYTGIDFRITFQHGEYFSSKNDEFEVFSYNAYRKFRPTFFTAATIVFKPGKRVHLFLTPTFQYALNSEFAEAVSTVIQRNYFKVNTGIRLLFK